MATPRVFISSTCYDLGQIRDSLSEFIKSNYYEPFLSEKGDVFYHPDLHTHDSCINEIENCQLFILIIGGRFGGKYKFDKTKSITNAEYESARFKKIPVFTFIKRDVFEDLRVYQKNKQNEELIKQIEFPSIENQEYAINIFEFINQVRISEVNNGLFPFEYVNDIKNYLGKQWAGMMFDFLNARNKDYDQRVVNATLDNLTLINKKTEELIEVIVRKLSPSEGSKQIENIDKILAGSRFYKYVLTMFKINYFENSIKEIIEIEPSGKNWYEYLAEFKGFSLINKDNLDLPETNYKTTLSLNYNSSYWSVETDDDILPDQILKIREYFESVSILNKREREKALSGITFLRKDLSKIKKK